MPYYRVAGEIPRKHHVRFQRPDGGLYSEELMGEEGFVSDSSLLYHVHPPTAIVKSEGVSGTAAADSAPFTPASTCPDAMVLVDGMYCPNLTQVCLRWVDPPTDRYANTRCAEFKHPARCEGPLVHQRYCIDRDEYVRPPEVLPAVHFDWNEAQAACEERGARLCSEAQWEHACEGDVRLPYPYGFSRDSSACNFDLNPGFVPGLLNVHLAPSSPLAGTRSSSPTTQSTKRISACLEMYGSCMK